MIFRMVWKSRQIFSSVLSQYTRLTNRQTEFSSQDRVCIPCSVVKTVISRKLQIVSRSIWGSSWYRQLHFVASSTLPTSNPIWLPATILKKMIWRHNSADDHPITTKFDRQMQNGMPMTIHGSKSSIISQPWIELSHRNWVRTTHIDFHLLKQMQSLHLNPKIHFRLYGRQL